MGKQKLKGKGRQDKYYHLAKETGYRARSSFKLLQLNKKFNFLQESKVLVDLCAAPGGWLQVAAEHMPMSSVIVGVDLCPIKPIRGVQTFQDDITTDSCRNKIKSELHGWSVDCFLNDGAPNVGKNWLHDAFSQSVLTLHALKLACSFLRKGGWFVTKVFRSKDYQALLWVFNQLFHKVHSTKPSASRNVSAEIFVVCQKFKYDSIKKIDKNFFDPRSVFEEVEERSKTVTIMDFEPKKRKAKGYSDVFKPLVYQRNTVEEFVQSDDPLAFLKQATTIVVNDEEQKEQLGMDDNLVECLKDTKLLGKREVKLIAKWHAKARKILDLDGEISGSDDEGEKEEEEELDSDAELDKIVAKAEEEEAREKRRKKKATKKSKQKIAARKQNLKHSGLIEDQTELFDLHDVKSKNDLKKVDGGLMDQEHPSDSEIDDDDESSEEEVDESSDEEEENPLLVKEQAEDNKWFQNSVFEDIEDEADDIAQASKYYEQKKKANQEEKAGTSKSETPTQNKKRPAAQPTYMGDSDSDDEVPVHNHQQKQSKKIKLDPEALALGTAIATSNKSKMAVIDGSFNRYTYDDEPGALPDFFMEDEQKRLVRTNLADHIDKELVNHYKGKDRNINERTIKKVVEAKFRKRYHHMKRVERANKQASAITDSTEMSNKEKAAQLKNLYKKSGLSKKKEHTTYVFARKGMGQRVKRPAGVQGRFRIVDKRMKKELRAKKSGGKKK